MLNKDQEGKDTLWTRRDFFSLAGWGSFFAVIGASLLGFTRFMFPRVLFEPSPIFKAGYTDDYSIGAVSTKYIKEYRVWIVRDEEGIFAVSAICTHLGCTPNWQATENKYKCPCHGSGFTRDGVNFEGPAPRALERVKVALGSDGQIIVDKSKSFRYEKAEWGKTGSIIKV